MVLFFQILIAMFIAEMGDKTQLMLVAMASRYKLRDIVIGSALAILLLNGLAVGVGGLISKFVPLYIIKIIAGAAFFYFAYATLRGGEEEEHVSEKKLKRLPFLSVFGTFFLAELGDKTQLTAITFAANYGINHALVIWLACSAGLFAADIIGMLAGYLLKSKMPKRALDTLAFVIFMIFGIVTMYEGTSMRLSYPFNVIVTVTVAVLFAVLCVDALMRRKKMAKS